MRFIKIKEGSVSRYLIERGHRVFLSTENGVKYYTFENTEELAVDLASIHNFSDGDHVVETNRVVF